MPYYLIQAAYTPEAWANFVKHPRDRTEVVRQSVEKLGGTLEGFWLAFGDYDAVCVVNMPDNVSAAGFSVAVAAGGALKASKTTPLLTVAEGMDAMRKAATTGYQPPSG